MEHPLSAAQAGMWFAQQLDPDNPAFVTGQCIDIVGPVDAATLARAVDVVVAQSPELRTRIDVVDGEVVQVPGGAAVPSTPVVTSAGIEAALGEMRAQLRQPIDLTAQPGYGATVHVLGPDHVALFHRAHHVLLDVYGYSLLGRRIAAVYNALAAGAEPPAPRFDPVAKVIAAGDEYAESAVAEADRDFWVAELRGAPDSISPALAPPPSASAVARELRGRTVTLDAGAADRLDAVGRAAGGGWADAVTAVIAGYLARVTGELDVTLGFPAMNRLGTAAAKVLTTAVNVVPLRVSVDPGAGIAALTDSVRAAVARTAPHARRRAEDIHRALRLPAAAAGPVGPTVNIKPFGDTLRFTGATATVHSLARGPVRDIAFVVRRLDDTRALEIQIDADAERYTDADLDRLVAGLTRLVDAATVDGPALARVHLLDAASGRELAEWVGTVAVDDSRDVLARFDEQVAARPDALALVAGDDRLTYRELADRVDTLAAELTVRGAVRESLVALALPRTADVVVALLAVLRTGAGYVPLDPQFPTSRLDYMLADARPAILLTTAGFTGRVAVPAGTVVATVAGGVASWAESAEPGPSGRTAATPENTAYVIYTSGSTGNPKGVVLDRRALSRFVDTAAALAGIDSTTRLLAVTTLSFDIAVLELFVPLSVGGAVVLADEDSARDPAALADLIAAESVTAMQATPSLWGAVLEHPAVDLTSVAVLVGGEALPTPVAAALSARARTVTNMYGPTEATVWCTSAPVPADREWSGSIGSPFPGTAAAVLDRFLQPVPAGVVGELYIAGPQLARGYRGRPDLTASRFVADPAGRGRLYRTGDLVRWSRDGALEYLGRGDDQVKVRGHRIELGEIETVAAGFNAVSAAVAVARPDATGALHLAAYVTPADGASVDTDALRAHLAAALPEYMVPSALVVLDEFPLTPNLKVDRKALPEPDFGAIDTGRSARTTSEHAVAAMFADLLGLGDPGVDADFFTLGGTSLSATRLLARIAGTLGVSLSLREVFDAPTVAGIAAVVDSATPTLSAVTPVPRTEEMPLSAAQQRLWFLHRAHGPSATYNVPFVLRISGTVDVDALHRALAAVVARHEVLRSVVVDSAGVGVARILPPATVIPTVVADVTETELDSALRDAARAPFDLTAEIPIRAHLLRTAPDAAVLLLVIHHLAGDEWSAGPLLRDLATVYSGGDLPGDAGRIQYADYAAWQEGNPEPAAALDFWRSELAGVPEELALPRDRTRPAVSTQRGADVWLHLGAGVIDGLRARAAGTGTSMFMTVQAAVALLLARLGGGDDIVLGAPVAGRGAGGVEDVVGLFVDTVALRVDLSGDPTVTELLDRVRRTDLDAFAHQDAQFEDVVDAAGVTRSLSRHPLFQTLVQHRTPHVAPSFAGLDVEPSYLSTGTAKFDLTFEFVELPAGLDVRVEYALDLFDRETVDAIAKRLTAVLGVVAGSGDPAVHAVDVLLPSERDALVGPATPSVPMQLLPDVLAAADHEFADRVALVADAAELTYADLSARVNRLARVLIDRGVGPDTIVAVAATRTAATVVALRAVIAAGAAYLPVDPSYPATRIEHMLTDAAPALVLTDAEAAAAVSPLVSTSPVVTIADLEADAAERSTAEIDDAERITSLRGANLAYVVYTSGSTGVPKGVPGTVAALTNRILWQHDLPVAGDVRLAKSSLSFIDGSTELLAGLLSGARLVLADDAAAKDPGAMADLVAAHGVTQVTAVPSLAVALVEAGAHVPTWFLSGEPLEPRVIDALTGDVNGGVTVYNSYGSSEVAGDVNVWAADGPQVLIGAAVPGVTEYVLDARLQPVPDGVVGELHVGGVQLARGYLGRPGLTVARFVANPFGGGRLFRTGDLVRRTRTGELAFVSRADSQMSLHGFRIEPGEVEAALAAHPDVERAVVMVRAGASGADQLVGYVAGDANLAGDDLRIHLRDRLPDYMIPAAFVVLGEFPTLPNGKVDRDALPAPSRDVARREPVTDAERDVCDAVAELLGLSSVGPDEDFFALGGNSLLATRLSFAIRARLGREVGIREIFDLRTPARLAVAATAPSARVPLVRGEHADLVPMSAAQGRLWFLFQLEGAGPTYNIPFTMRLRGRVDVDALRGALAHLLTVHESLRTVFTSGDGHIGYQRVLDIDECEVPLAVDDVDAADLDARLVDASTYAFDITAELPLRAVLVRTAPDDAHLMLLVHHIAADEWSARPLIADLAAAYSHLSGSDVALPQQLPVQYRDFSVWQPQVLGDPTEAGSPVATQLDHWTAVLAGQPEELTLPRDRPRPAVAGYRGSAVGFTLGSDVARSLAAVAADSGATMFMLTHAAVAVLLRELGAGDDIVVGSPVAGRADAALERVVGFFVNTLVLRTDLSGDPTFAQLLRRVRDADLDAYAHQDVPFEVLVERMAPARSLSRQPLFQVLVQYRDPIDPVAMTGLDVAPVFVETGTSKFDLTFELAAADDGGVRGRIEYATDLFDHATAQSFADRLTLLLEQIAAHPESALSSLDPLTDADRAALAAAESGHTVGVDESTLSELFAGQAAATPDALALVVDDTGQEWTYAQLDRAAAALAAHLQGAAGGVVAVSVRRSAALVVALLAIHRAGAGYLPLDDSYPADRLSYMVADARPALVLLGPDVARIDTDARVVEIDSDGAVLGASAAPASVVPVLPDSAAYLLYTSGSTGRPKGVVVSHRAIVNRLAWMQAEYGLTAADRVLQKTPSGFDVSVWEFFWPLITGATLVVARPDGHRDPQYLREVIARRGVTTAHFVPSMLAAFLDGLAEADPADARPALARVLCSGEALTTEHRDRFHVLVDAPLFNLYGPTEAAVDVTATPVAEWVGDGPGWVPIGSPVWNTRVLVLDERLRRVAPGVTGELYLGGVQLARGYHGRPALTADRFVADPYGAPGERLYRTGDLVRWRSTGSGSGPTLALDYLGRADGQVKLRGQRVELGEIESVLAGHPDVAQSAALVRSGRIDAYVVPAPGQAIAIPELLAFAAQTLPEHMLPTAVVVLGAFPLSANGKLDRKALPEPAPPAEATRRAPDGPREAALCELYAEALRVDEVGADDDFFLLGGDSIISIQVVNAATRRGITFGPREIFQWRTPAALARVAEFADAGADSDAGPVDPAESGALPLTALVHRARESGREPAGIGAAVTVETEPGATLEQMQAAVDTLVATHDALRLGLTRVASVLWSLESHAATSVPVSRTESNGALAQQCSEAESSAIASLEPEAGLVVAATWIDGGEHPGALVVAVHPFAADSRSLAVLADDLRALLRGGSATRPAATAYGLAHRLNDRAQDPVLMAELTHWSQVLAPGGSLRVGVPALPALVPDRGSVTVDAVFGGPGIEREVVVVAAVAEAVAHWRGSVADLVVEVRRDAQGGVDGDPDGTRTVGPFEVGVPVRVGDGGLDTARAALAAAPSTLGYGMLRYLGAQTAPVFAALARPEVSVRVTDASDPEQAVVDPRPIDVTVVFGGGLARVRVDHDAVQVVAADARAIAEGVAGALTQFDAAGLSTAGQFG